MTVPQSLQSSQLQSLQSLQTTLAGEHAAVYVYGVLGGRVSVSGDPALARLVSAAYATHRSRRDRLVMMVRDRGGLPVPAEVSYQLPNPVRSARQIRRAGLGLEERCARVYAEMVASTSGTTRRWAAQALTDAAVRQLGFGGEPQAFPGVTEL